MNAVPREWAKPVESELWQALESLEEPELAIATRLCVLAVELVARGRNVISLSGDAGSLRLEVAAPENIRSIGNEPNRVPAADTLRTRIRAERKARYWSVRDMAERLRKASDNPDRVPHIQSLIRMIRHWEAGRRNPSEQYRLLYCKAFGMTEDELSSAFSVPEKGCGNSCRIRFPQKQQVSTQTTKTRVRADWNGAGRA